MGEEAPKCQYCEVKRAFGLPNINLMRHRLLQDKLLRTCRPVKLYIFCITDTHFDLERCYDLSLRTTQNPGYASVHTQYSNQATDKEVQGSFIRHILNYTGYNQ